MMMKYKLFECEDMDNLWGRREDRDLKKKTVVSGMRQEKKSTRDKNMRDECHGRCMTWIEIKTGRETICR
jgi:hypothetical protein